MNWTKVSKLVFLSNVPENMEKNSYVCCVSVNEIEMELMLAE